ncbi:hypothetical protein ACFL35_21980, partial [Candidatus Riflebacteria bacterium]
MLSDKESGKRVFQFFTKELGKELDLTTAMSDLVKLLEQGNRNTVNNANRVLSAYLKRCKSGAGPVLKKLEKSEIKETQVGKSLILKCKTL